MKPFDEEQIKHIYMLLNSQRFDDWYTGEFNDYVEGVIDAPSKEEILSQIHKMINPFKI